MAFAEPARDLVAAVLDVGQKTPLSLIFLLAVTSLVGFASIFYLALFIAAPIPRAPLRSEKRFRTALPDGGTSDLQQLSCWQDSYMARRDAARQKGDFSNSGPKIEPAEVFMSLVVPAYNEEERLSDMLEEAVAYLRDEYGSSSASEVPPPAQQNGRAKTGNDSMGSSLANGSTRHSAAMANATGWEVVIVSDGSTDRTIETALDFARKHHLSFDPTSSLRSEKGSKAPEASLRVVSLEHNRGKGGAVTHGMRHVRGEYAVFADADGASRFTDLGKLVAACRKIKDDEGRGVAVGSRAHLVGSEAVVKRSFLRNLLMHSFHLFLRLLTPPATAAIKDTQCGFKLFSRPALPYIIPYMHSEGWIFDVEMLMLAESAGIPVAEVAVGWKEVKGSKLNVIWDSLGMAWGLAVLRAAWGLGVYRRH